MKLLLHSFGLQTGYHVATDCPMSITVGLGSTGMPRGMPQYRLILSFAWHWPKIIWDEDKFEQRFLDRGLLAPRMGIASSAWTGRSRTVRGVVWVRHWSVKRVL